MKKIVFLHPFHWEQTMGGAELQISYLIGYFKKLGHDVHFIYENQETYIKNVDGIILHPLKKINIKGFLGRRWSLYTVKITQLLKVIQPDVIYTRFYSSWSGMAAKYAKKHHIIHIWAIANNEDLRKKVNSYLLTHPLDLVEKLLLQKAFKYSTYILVQNAYQEEMIAKGYGRKSIKIKQMTPLVDDNQINKSEEIIKIIWVANFKPFKHPEYFIELVKSLQIHENCRFIMAGRMDNRYLKLLSDTSEQINNFNYLEEISNEEVNKLFCESHILVNTSDHEGFSNTFVQGWMREVIVLSMNSNPDNILAKYNIGYLCPTIKDMQEKIEFLIYNRSVRIKMGEKAREYAVKNHSLDENISKVRDLINLQ